MHAVVDQASRAQLVLIGASLGLLWGVLARLWMRLIATDPDFTWGGSLYIVGAATIFGLGVGGAAAGRRSRRRWVCRVTRVLGAISLFFLGAAAGALMVAFVVPAALAITERRWWKPVRIALLVLSLLPLKVVWDEIAKDFSTTKTAVGVALYLALAAVLIVGWGSIVGSRSRAAGRDAEGSPHRVGGGTDGGLEFIG